MPERKVLQEVCSQAKALQDGSHPADNRDEFREQENEPSCLFRISDDSEMPICELHIQSETIIRSQL